MPEVSLVAALAARLGVADAEVPRVLATRLAVVDAKVSLVAVLATGLAAVDAEVLEVLARIAEVAAA